MLRLKELQAVALTVGEPEDDDLVLRASDGCTQLAAHRQLMDRLGGEAELVVGVRETGEPDFKLVRESTGGQDGSGNVRGLTNRTKWRLTNG